MRTYCFPFESSGRLGILLQLPALDFKHGHFRLGRTGWLFHFYQQVEGETCRGKSRRNSALDPEALSGECAQTMAVSRLAGWAPTAEWERTASHGTTPPPPAPSRLVHAERTLGFLFGGKPVTLSYVTAPSCYSCVSSWPSDGVRKELLGPQREEVPRAF